VTDPTKYTPRPHRTLEEIEALVAFIDARIEPLRVATKYDGEERKALQALANLVHYVKGLAKAEIKYGDDPSNEFHALAMAAWKWKDHPDWQPGWDPAD
jgi:hypothetical protein